MTVDWIWAAVWTLGVAFSAFGLVACALAAPRMASERGRRLPLTCHWGEANSPDGLQWIHLSVEGAVRDQWITSYGAPSDPVTTSASANRMRNRRKDPTQ
jgi:hypothetical protein